MRVEEAFYNISMNLYNKNVLEYAQIARSGPKSMIRNIEGFSSGFGVCLQEKAIIPHLIIGLTKHVVITLFILTVSFN